MTYRKYQFKGMVCFIGAHYLSFFRNLNKETGVSSYKVGKWTMYNDEVTEIYNWEKLITICSEYGMRPTILFFKRIDEPVSYLGSLGFSTSIDQTELKL